VPILQGFMHSRDALRARNEAAALFPILGGMINVNEVESENAQATPALILVLGVTALDAVDPFRPL
jgi:hypothetical protein